MIDIVVFGAGQIAEVVATYLDHHAQVRIVAFTVDHHYRKIDHFRGVPVVDWETVTNNYPPDQVQLFGPASFRDNNRFRRDRFLEGKQLGYKFYTFVHPATHIYSQEIGENCLILEGNTIQPSASLGDNCILWSHNHIGHHTRIGPHCFLASHVGIGGNTQIGEGVFFAGKSGAIDNLSIGAWSFFSPGAIATADIQGDSIVVAPKAKTIEGGAKRYAKRLLG